ncbi:MAG: Gfo/Idh/MocA family oxidoreductase [Candidatus Bathyarchaeia archaeon]
MDKVGFGVIGAGFWGKNHSRVLAELPNTELVAVCDIDSSRAQEVARKYGAEWYTNLEEFLKRTDVGAVCVCTPTTTHATVSLAALSRGKHLLIEKPIADSVESARKIVNAVRRRDLLVMVGFIERFNPGLQRLKNLIESGALGDIVLVFARRVGRWPERVGDVGVIKDSAIHDLDLMRYLFNEEPLSVYARAGSLGHKFEDYAEIMLKFSGIRSGFVEANWLTPRKIRTLTVTGKEGIAVLDFITQEIVLENAYETVIKKHEWKEPLKAELEHFATSIQEGRQPDVTAYDGLRALEICEAALISAETGTVQVPKPTA